MIVGKHHESRSLDGEIAADRFGGDPQDGGFVCRLALVPHDFTEERLPTFGADAVGAVIAADENAGDAAGVVSNGRVKKIDEAIL